MNRLNAKIVGIPMPVRMHHLPLSSEGYPVPWFVPYVDGEPEFRGMDGKKFVQAVRTKRCWLCGNYLGQYLTFPIGPMCAITRTTAEPPSHLECATYGAKACPFLTQPRMRRNKKDMPEGATVAGIMIERNPGVVVLWTCRDYKTFRDARDRQTGGILFEVGDPAHVECYSEGRRATKEELRASMDSGYPLLEAQAEGAVERKELEACKARAYSILGL